MAEWRVIPGHHGKYEVSDEGEVRTLDWRGTGQPRLLTPTKSGGLTHHSGAYLKVGLSYCEDGRKRRIVELHRLVAEVFLPNPDNLPCVQHLDDNPANNRVENLAWTTYHDNNVHNNVHIRRAETRCRGVVGVHGDDVVRFRSAHEAVMSISGSSGGRLVTKACREGGGYAYGYAWWYVDEYEAL